MTLRAGVFLAFCALLLATACSNRDGGSFLASVPAAKPGGIPVNVRLRIPAQRHTRNPRLRRERFVAASTLGIQVLAYRADSPHNGKTLLASLLMNLAKNSGACMVGSGGTRVCSGKIVVPPPAVDFVVTTWDQPPIGQVPAGKQLAAGNFPDRKIQRGKPNQLGLTVGGIPASLAIALPSPTPVAGVETAYIHGTSASNTTIDANAYDADGNLILADNYVNADGDDRNLTLTLSPSAATCGSATMLGSSGTPSTTLQIPAPQVNGITFEYGQTALAQPFTAASPCTFTLVATMPGLAPATGAVALTGPTLSTYPVTGKHGASAPDGIVSGPDNNIWFADPGGEGVGVVNVANPSSPIVEYEAGTSPAAPFGIVVGTNNNLWFTENGHLGTFSTGSPASVSWYAIAGSPALGEQITKGPADVLEWFVSSSADEVYRINDSGAGLVPYTPATPLPAGPSGIVADSSYPGHTATYVLVVADQTNNTVDVISTNGVQIATYALAGTASNPQFVALDGYGFIWFTSAVQGSIDLVTPGGSYESFPIGSGAKPWGLTFGPDGAMWFADCGKNAIGRIPLDATSPSQITEFPVGAGTKPKWVTFGSDGALWFTASGTGSIGRLTI